jgi:hypothetical protein
MNPIAGFCEYSSEISISIKEDNILLVVSLSGTQEDFCSMEPTDRLQRD